MRFQENEEYLVQSRLIHIREQIFGHLEICQDMLAQRFGEDFDL